MRKIHPADPSTVFWFWSQCLEDLIGWATDPDPEVISTDGWREHFRNDIRDKGNRARDASPDGVTRNQVTRSRRLASRLVRMLNETPELNERPCRNWSQVDRLVVEQLADLQVVFAKVSDGTTKVVAVVATPQRQQPVWSIARSPSDWIKVFGKLNVDCRSASVFYRRRKAGKYHKYQQHPDSTSKSVRLALKDLPPTYSDTMTV